MNKILKYCSIGILGCTLVSTSNASAAAQKIVSVDLQKVFEKYEAAQTAQAAYNADFEAAGQEFRGMYDEGIKLQEEINALHEKADNEALLDSAREKYRNEAEEKIEQLRAKETEFIQMRQEANKKFAERRNKELLEQEEAIKEATAIVAKKEKADIVLNKIPGTLYVKEDLDITELVIKQLNNKK